MHELFDRLRAKTIQASRSKWFWRGLAVCAGVLVVGAFALLRAQKDRELAALRLERDRQRLKAEKAEYEARSAPNTQAIEMAQLEATIHRAELATLEIALKRAEKAAEEERKAIREVTDWAGLRRLQEAQKP